MITVGRLQVTHKWHVVAQACYIATLRTLGLGLWGSGLAWLLISPSTGVLLMVVGTLVRRLTTSATLSRTAGVQALLSP